MTETKVLKTSTTKQKQSSRNSKSSTGVSCHCSDTAPSDYYLLCSVQHELAEVRKRRGGSNLAVQFLQLQTNRFLLYGYSFPARSMENDWLSSVSRKKDKSDDCSLSLDDFSGRITPSMTELSTEVLEKKYDYLFHGGHHIPVGCNARDKMAVIIPFRNRDAHLHILLNNLHSFLTKQMLEYSIIVVEQISGQTFNRAKLFNAGFIEAMSMYEWNCILFHDVDVLPEDDRIVHTCSLRNPRHMAVALNKFGYKIYLVEKISLIFWLPYATMFGTSTALTVEQFRMVNGFSNRFWGWGGEDDDLYKRVITVGYDVDRYPENIARYTMIKHGGEPKSNPVNKCRWKLLDLTETDWKKDGLNSLNYTLIKKTKKKLYTHILVDLLEDDERPFLESSFCDKD
ncbi:hypothetical protein RB195_012905 [Necator americanus]|uniref:Beta-1,4-N-acetylgalactosaminyltransferase n=1 Tax=Necator americanus TaxID=51031 RepID=A0ABR1DT38_NECAM